LRKHSAKPARGERFLGAREWPSRVLKKSENPPPEKAAEGQAGVRCADTVIDGEIVELKTVAGTRATLSKGFKKGYKQGASLMGTISGAQSHSVFIRLFSNLSAESVKAKIAGELKTRHDDGNLICFFEATGELRAWSFSELRAMIGKK